MLVLISGTNSEFTLYWHGSIMVLRIVDVPDSDRLKEIILRLKSYKYHQYIMRIQVYDVLPPILITDKRITTIEVNFISHEDESVSSCVVIVSDDYLQRYKEFNPVQPLSRNHPGLRKLDWSCWLPTYIGHKRIYVYSGMTDVTIQIVGMDNDFHIINDDNIKIAYYDGDKLF